MREQVEIKQIGLKASVVDSGRTMCQSKGFCPSGPFDVINYQLAHKMLSLAYCALTSADFDMESSCRSTFTTIEVLGGNFTCKTSVDCLMVVTGANADLQINNQAVKPNTVYQLQCGDDVHIGKLYSGLVNYLSLSVAVDITLFYSSVCAVGREKSGGLRGNGKSLKVGETLHVLREQEKEVSRPQIKSKQLSRQTLGSDSAKRIANFQIPKALQNFISTQLKKHKTLKVSLSYQCESFDELALHRFFSHDFKVTNMVDGMGVRLEGPNLQSSIVKLYSQPIVNGAIQISSNGQAIIMRQDRQTIGGYPIIGTVAPNSLALLAHAMPGDTLSFWPSDMERDRADYLLMLAMIDGLKMIGQ